jgi:hypothetical protein
MRRLLDDPETSIRCRRLADEHFSLERGVRTLLDLYRDAADLRRGDRSAGS